MYDVFQSTLPARGATNGIRRRGAALEDFNPRSPHGERPRFHPRLVAQPAFQSTLPARGATIDPLTNVAISCDFNPRSPHGERPIDLSIAPSVDIISIHAPRTGSDSRGTSYRATDTPFQSTLPARGATDMIRRKEETVIFQSTLPARGATAVPARFDARHTISIHAPRTGSDIRVDDHWTPPKEISIHAPRTGSDASGFPKRHSVKRFQSTLPARGATPSSYS